MMRLFLSYFKAYRKTKGGKWYKVMNFIGDGKYFIYWKIEEKLMDENANVLSCEEYN